MNDRDRAEFIALEYFEYDVPFGVYDIRMVFREGDKFTLRPSGKMAKDLLRRGLAKRLEA